MQTFVLCTDQAPSMEDAYAVLKMAIGEFGVPDCVVVLDPNDDAVFALQQGGIAIQIAENVRDVPNLTGDCKFIMSMNGNSRGDALIRDWFRRFGPASGFQSSLLRLSGVNRSGGGKLTCVTTFGEKP